MSFYPYPLTFTSTKTLLPEKLGAKTAISYQFSATIVLVIIEQPSVLHSSKQ